MTTAPEPKGKLDAMTVQLDAEAEAGRIVNGPEGDVLVMDWDAIDWRAQVLPVIERDDVVVIGGDDDGSMRTAPLGVLSGAVVVSVTGSSPR